MTGLGTRLSTAMGRTGVWVIALVGALLVAPMATAAPDTDADAAITQAWDAGGGPTGPLGIKNGGVYPVGAGFGQDFAAGKIFFTPDTGAHAMQGAILDKYESLGGPADGDLGFPTIDEGDGRAPGSRNTTFSAADRPVIFWTPDSGARVVRGALNAAWDKLGGSAGVLGVPSEDEVYGGDDVSQSFTGGQVSWNRKTNAFTTTPPELADQLAGLEVPGDVTTAIDAARRAAGGPLGPLGAADGDRYSIGADGAGQNFAGGRIYYSPATGANVLTGQVLAKYESVGGPQGDLGLPTSNENDGGVAPASRFATFAATDQPVIFWTPDFGAVIVRGAMNAAWAKLGGATGSLGAPTADQTENGHVVTQKFSGGAITWNESTNGFTTEPAGLASQLTGLQVPGREIPKPQTTVASDGGGSTWFRPNRWWLLGIVPVIVLLGVAAFAVARTRRRHDDHYDGNYDDDQHDDDRHDDEYHDDGHHDDGHHYGGEGDRDQPEDFAADLTSDQDAIDTAPTPVATVSDEPKTVWFSEQDEPRFAETPEGAEAAGEEPAEASAEPVEAEVDGGPPQPEPEPDSGPPSGRHSAITLHEPAVTEPSLRLATEDQVSPPDGYPVKADTKTGVYWTPGSDRYDRARAEIWFTSEEFALTNGFTKGD